MAQNQINWPSAFVAFCQGHPLSEIAGAFGMTEQALRERIAKEKWGALRSELPLQTLALGGNLPAQVPEQSQGATLLPIKMENGLPVEAAQKFALMRLNRSENFNKAQRLQKKINQLLTALEEGRLKIEQVGGGKNGTWSAKRDLNMQDLVAFATFCKLVQDMGYRALGDFAAAEKGAQDGTGGHTAPPPITIVLPGILSLPRSERAKMAKAAKVIDVDSVPQTPPGNNAPKPGAGPGSPPDSGVVPPSPPPA